MIELVKRMMENVLTALYQMFGFSFVMAILFMFVYLFAKEFGWKHIIHKWLLAFKQSKVFRRVFLLVFYIAMILFRTLLNRHMWQSPLANVIGIWGLYNESGELVTEAIENFVLFIPFVLLLYWSFKDTIFGERVTVYQSVWYSIKIVFAFSLTIECAQLFFRLGTFQLSDLFYNTLGGCVGGILYWVGYRITHSRRINHDELCP